MFRYSNVPMFQCFNISMFQCSNVLMFQSNNVPMFQFSNVQMFRCLNVKCSNVQIFKSSHVPMFKCSTNQLSKLDKLVMGLFRSAGSKERKTVGLLRRYKNVYCIMLSSSSSILTGRGCMHQEFILNGGKSDSSSDS